MWVEPVTLEGTLVRLEPLGEDHVGDLAVAGGDPETWAYMTTGPITSPGRMAAYVRDAGAAGVRAFAVVENGEGRAIGSTRYLDIRENDRGLEIGGTWYGPAWRRTGVNTECKRLLLAHAFESLGAIRVQLKADARNERSLRAIERIGATREGVLRDQLRLPDGFVRSTVYYSILEAEWPAVRERIDRLIAARTG